MADQVLTEPEQFKIFDEFEKLEVKKIGLGKQEQYHQLLHELRDIYPVCHFHEERFLRLDLSGGIFVGISG